MPSPPRHVGPGCSIAERNSVWRRSQGKAAAPFLAERLAGFAGKAWFVTVFVLSFNILM
jgi:hypothetical protein